MNVTRKNVDREVIYGTSFKYVILNNDTKDADKRDDEIVKKFPGGFIAAGTESIVYIGKKFAYDDTVENAVAIDDNHTSCEEDKKEQANTVLYCALKFKLRGANDCILKRFKNKDLRIFNKLQGCRSVVRIFDVIENIGSFTLDTPIDRIDPSTDEYLGKVAITSKDYFCVVEEYVYGKTLEEYCLNFPKENKLIDYGNLGKINTYHDFNEKTKKKIIEEVERYELLIKFQSKMYEFMLKLCSILSEMYNNDILHLDIKPDNIMITDVGDELVLIDFGRSDFTKLDNNIKYVEPVFDNQSISEYGTVGFASPEAYNPDVSNEYKDIEFNFKRFGEKVKDSDNESPVQNDNMEIFVKQSPDENGRLKRMLTIESDIFSFGATFWECFSIFTLFLNSREYSEKIQERSHYQKFYQKKYDLGNGRRFCMLSNRAYFDRDLSLNMNGRFHSIAEDIIKKCTHRNGTDYTNTESDEFFHSYDELKKEIIRAQSSSPELIRTENEKLVSTFNFMGGIIAVMGFLLIANVFANFVGSNIAQTKIDNIISNYSLSNLADLKNAYIEKVTSIKADDRKQVYLDFKEFLKITENHIKDSDDIYISDSLSQCFCDKEVKALVEVLKLVDDEAFAAVCIDEIMKGVDELSVRKSASYIIDAFPDDMDCDGYRIAEFICALDDYDINNDSTAITNGYMYIVYEAKGNEKAEYYVPLVNLATWLKHDNYKWTIANNISDINEDTVEHELQQFLDYAKGETMQNELS